MKTKPITGTWKLILRRVPYNPYVRELVIREWDGRQWNCIHRLLHHRDNFKEPKRQAEESVFHHNWALNH
jgi:hypothetical protein